MDLVEAVGDRVEHVHLHQVQHQRLTVSTESTQVLNVLCFNTVHCDLDAFLSPDGAEKSESDAVGLHLLRVERVDVVGVTISQKCRRLAARVDDERMSVDTSIRIVQSQARLNSCSSLQPHSLARVPYPVTDIFQQDVVQLANHDLQTRKLLLATARL